MEPKFQYIFFEDSLKCRILFSILQVFYEKITSLSLVTHGEIRKTETFSEDTTIMQAIKPGD